MQPMFARHLNLLITIVDRDRGQIAVDLLLKEGVLFHRIVLGRGTAQTEILDLLGIGETAKDIIFSVMPEEKTRRVMNRLRNTLQFDNPGHGIAFTVPITSVAGMKTLRELGGYTEVDPKAEESAKKEKKMDAKQYELIIAIVNNGYADDVMDAARPAGARGGTVVHARGAGIQEAEKFFGITIQPEKEMVLILSRHEEKRAIMEAICHKAGITTEGHGVVFSLPAFDVMGVARMLREDDDVDDED
ncbi:P-II family nitrogen regulator [Eubacteriales bacterium OttesenSCG-928-A19]|nr:P-II family nitrogen regulator [Eubacteriales bacterium OttesenSCG-928-A19]